MRRDTCLKNLIDEFSTNFRLLNFCFDLLLIIVPFIPNDMTVSATLHTEQLPSRQTTKICLKEPA